MKKRKITSRNCHNKHGLPLYIQVKVSLVLPHYNLTIDSTYT